MTSERLDRQLEDLRTLVERSRKAASDPSVSKKEREKIAVELKAVQEQIRRITRTL